MSTIADYFDDSGRDDLSSGPAYDAYAERVLMPSMDQGALAEIKRFEATNTTDDPRYMELLYEHHYVEHVLRLPLDQWPDPVNRAFAAINQSIYVPIQGRASSARAASC